MSRRSADSILFRIEPSPGLTALLAAGHSAGFLAGVAAGGSRWALAWLVALGVGLVHALRRDALRCGPRAVRQLVLGSGEECIAWRAGDGDGFPVHAAPALVSGAMIVLRLRRAGARPEYVVVCADAVPADVFRRLRARYRLSPAAG